MRTTRGRAAHVAHGATRAARGESERRAPSELAVRVRGNGRPGLPWGFPLLRARSCSVRSAPRDRRRARRAQNERARDASGARRGARGVRGRHGKSAFLCRGSRSARVLCLSLLSSLRAALLPRSPPRGGARTSGHATHARSESRVSGALCVFVVCLRLVPRLGAAGRARVYARVRWKTGKTCYFSLMRCLAGLGGPWRPKNTHTNHNRIALRSCLMREMRVFRSFKTGLAGVDLPAVSFSLKCTQMHLHHITLTSPHPIAIGDTSHTFGKPSWFRNVCALPDTLQPLLACFPACLLLLLCIVLSREYPGGHPTSDVSRVGT